MSRHEGSFPAGMLAALLLWSELTQAAPRTFVPDYSFSGSSLKEWRELGSADWRAQNGEIIGTPKSIEGGWLVFDRRFQDVGVAVNFRCAQGCNTGVAFSQPHGTSFADMDGDGITDFVVGKRFWSHRDTYLDPDPYGPAVLYVYRMVRNAKAPGGAEFVPELVHNHSGVGSDVLPFDVNRDGRMDIVTATRFGTFIFWGQPGRR